MRRSHPFRTGGVTKTFAVTLLPRLVDEHRPALSGTVEEHLRKPVRGEGDDGRAPTLRSPPHRTGGPYGCATDAHGTVSVTPRQALCVDRDPPDPLRADPIRPGPARSDLIRPGPVPSASACRRQHRPTAE
ncbi:serine hydrolase [Streptomyces sp. MAR25Y5]|nr:serine hydrolase [Streptomyces sp. MAR25Y5]